MKTSNYTVRIIEPNENLFLTQKSNPGVVISKKVYLAIDDTPENWIEITQEEVDKYEAIKKAEAEELAKQEEQNKNIDNSIGDL